MKRTLIALLFMSLVLAGCEDPGPGGGKPPPKEDDGSGSMGGGAPASGGGGDVAIAGASDGTIADRYEKALKMIKDKDWDGAREQLMEAYRRSDSPEVKKEVQGHLAMVEQGLTAQPTLSAPEILGMAPKLMEKKVSMRGKVIQGGPVARVTYYIWLESGAKIQCRFATMSLEEKKLILSLPDGSDALLRGTLKPAWGSNPNPYIEMSYFRLIRRAEPAPAPEAAPAK
ncbi:MAG: hypothetical protein HYZ75_02565 [Elusimicrobia bacterium]|nr:hypothetical protein [Elusimicrobiota bacterium]